MIYCDLVTIYRCLVPPRFSSSYMYTYMCLFLLLTSTRKLSIYTSNIACIWNVSAFEILRFVVKETRHIKISVSNYDYSYSLLNVISKQKNIYLSAYLLLCIARNIRHTDLINFFLSNKRWSIEIFKWNLLSSYKKQTFWEK